MADNTAGKDGITIRREVVAALRARHLTQRQIAESLAKMNPPIIASIPTVNRDLRAIREDWKARAAEQLDAWIADELADIDELEKLAWKEKRFDLVLKIKDRRAKLLGLDKPTRTELSGAEPITLRVVYGDGNAKRTRDIDKPA